MSTWIIKDWANNVMFNSKEFDTFDNADEFLTVWIEKTYPETIDNDDKFLEIKDEYYIEPLEEDEHMKEFS